MFFLNFHLLV